LKRLSLEREKRMPQHSIGKGRVPSAACRHKWAMTNVRSGYLVIEGCFHCRQRTSFFSEEPVPPIDDYREGDHFWTHLGDFQASKFDLKCRTCGRVVALKDVMAVMLCLRCDPACGVYKAGSDVGESKTWVYVALCANTSHVARTCVTDKGLRALSEYYNAGLRDPAKKIFVVPCRLRRSVDTCQGVVLADVGLTELY
jgi:hypothetical protein